MSKGAGHSPRHRLQRLASLETLKTSACSTPAGFAGKYGKALDSAIAAQQLRVEAAASAARAAAALREALEEAPKSVRHPLTDKQILDLGPGQPDAVWNYDSQVYFARAIEHAHGIE